MNDFSGFDLTKSAQRINDMVTNLGWAHYHRPRFLVAALAVEASELLDRTLWKSDDEIDAMFADGGATVADEIADVAINLISLVQRSEIDLQAAIAVKVDEIETRYTGLGWGNSRANQKCTNCTELTKSAWSWCPSCGTKLPTADSKSAG